MKTFYLIILNFIFALNINAQVSEEEFQALKAFYNSTGGNNWKVKTGWENINTTATKDDVTSEWKGLSVENGHVKYIQLSSNNLVGYLPAQIGDLTYLIYLEIGGNKLEGIIPSEIGNLINLTSITISGNQFNGPLPESMQNLTKLESIYMSNNLFNCDFPNQIFSKMVSLRRIDSSTCGWTGKLDDIFSNLPYLEALIVGDNKMTGTFPPSLNKLKLNTLHAYDNNFTGELPTLDSSKNTAYYITFWNNKLTGSIPQSYGNFTRLQFFHIESNKISGNIPAGMFTLILRRMNIHQNYITFEGIEPVYNQINDLAQKSYYTNYLFPLNQSEIAFNEGESLSLNAAALSVYNLGGNNNRYKWFCNEVEVYSGNDPSYNVSVSETSHSGIYRFEVTNTIVTDMTLKSENITVSVLVPGNNPPSDITINSSTISENFTGNIGTLKAIDPDTTDSHSFTLTKGNGTNDYDNGKFSIIGKTLKINSAADFETNSILRIYISANDFKGGIITKALTINVTDIDEAPEFQGQVTSTTIDETAPNGYNIMFLQAKDPEGNQVTYSITTGNENGAFGVEDNKLIVADNTQLNYDIKNQYIIKVNASDGENSSNIDIKISLSKINKMPVVENSSFSINENYYITTPIGAVTAMDPEGSQLSYSIIAGNDFNAFYLENNEIFINNPQAIDYDLKPAYILTINVSDGISNVPATITISLINEIDETGNDILSFSFNGMFGTPVIDYNTNTISAFITGLDITNVYPNFTISKGSVSDPISGSLFNFLTPQTINVISEVGVTKKWTITMVYPVAVKDIIENNIFVYPNPASDLIYISGVREKSRMLLLNSAGKPVIKKIITENENTINISALSPGFYLILLETSHAISHLRFVKD